MLLVLPVKTLLLFTALGVSSYSILSWIQSLTFFELIIYCSLFSGLSSIVTLLLLLSSLEYEEDSDTNRNNPVYCMKCGKSYGVDSDSVYFKQDRVVVEKDGSLIITTVFRPDVGVEGKSVETDRESVETYRESVDSESVEEIRERLEKEEPLPSPVEETNEFAELLNKTASSE